MQKICLPKNGAVQLQWLSFDSQTGADWEFSLENLGTATQLTYLAFDDCYPGNLFWPDALPQLQQLNLTDLSHSVPQKLLCHPMLTDLQLDRLRQPTLPEWFSGMTSLKRLEFMESELEVFPESVLLLTGLHYLEMSQMELLKCPPSFLSLALWPYLTRIDFSATGSCQLDFQLGLLDLSSALGSRREILCFDSS